jgi:hypothetical protein
MAQTNNLPPVVPIHAPTQAPDEPITSGADRGPGPDSSVLTARPAPGCRVTTHASSLKRISGRRLRDDCQPAC